MPSFLFQIVFQASRYVRILFPYKADDPFEVIFLCFILQYYGCSYHN